MRTVEQIYGDKAPAIRAGIADGHLRISTATVTISAESAKAVEPVKIEYEKVNILNEAGGLVLYGSLDKVFADTTYAHDLGVRNGIRTEYLGKVVDPDKELKKMAELGVKAGLYKTAEEGLAALKVLKAAVAA